MVAPALVGVDVGPGEHTVVFTFDGYGSYTRVVPAGIGRVRGPRRCTDWRGAVGDMGGALDAGGGRGTVVDSSGVKTDVKREQKPRLRCRPEPGDRTQWESMPPTPAPTPASTPPRPPRPEPADIVVGFLRALARFDDRRRARPRRRRPRLRQRDAPHAVRKGAPRAGRPPDVAARPHGFRRPLQPRGDRRRRRADRPDRRAQLPTLRVRDSGSTAASS